MVKEIDKAGIPVVHVTNLTSVAKVTGSNRIIPGVAIDNPCSDTLLPEDQQKKLQKKYMSRVIAALTTEIKDQTLF